MSVWFPDKQVSYCSHQKSDKTPTSFTYAFITQHDTTVGFGAIFAWSNAQSAFKCSALQHLFKFKAQTYSEFEWIQRKMRYITLNSTGWAVSVLKAHVKLPKLLAN